MNATHEILNRRSVAALAVIICAVFVLIPPVYQDEGYHLFADARDFFGIPNFWNVISNVPFLLIGAVGFSKARRVHDRALFMGVLLTAFGSAYYHLSPSDARLVWDRIPMTIIFMAFVCCALENERLVAPLVALGITSVLWWRFTGDLRPYGIVKFGPVLFLFAVMFNRTHRYMIAIVLLFGIAQLFELRDRAVYAAIFIGGHAMKHLVAGAATYLMLEWRIRGSVRVLPPGSRESAEAHAGA